MTWNKVSKPTESSVVTFANDAEPIGLLIAITGPGSQTTSVTSGWGDVEKPTVSSWTSVSKPTSSVLTMIAKPST